MVNRILTPEEMRERLSQMPEVRTPIVPVTSVSDIKRTIEREVTSNMRKVRAEEAKRKLSPAELRQGLDLLCQKYNFNPVEELIQIAQATDMETTKVSICRFLTEFMMPKLKSIEVSGSVDHNHTVVIRRYGPDGQLQDAPMRTLAPGQAMREMAAPIAKTIDAEVVR